MYMYLNKMFIIKSIKKLYTKASTGINIICFSLSVNFLFFFTFFILFIIPLFLVFSYIFIHWHCQVLYFYHFLRRAVISEMKKRRKTTSTIIKIITFMFVVFFTICTIKRCQNIFFYLLHSSIEKTDTVFILY